MSKKDCFHISRHLERAMKKKNAKTYYEALICNTCEKVLRVQRKSGSLLQAGSSL